MRAVIQRVTKASVTVGDELVSSIEKGLCVLLGISRHDPPGEMEYMVRKILNLRVFEDDDGKRWAKSVMDKQLEILCVSQFTLQSILKGNKPDFHQAMEADLSQKMYEEFLTQMRQAYNPEKIKDGRFGAYMQVNIQNDGPVTIQLESPLQAKGFDSGKEKGKGSKPEKGKNKCTEKKDKSAGKQRERTETVEENESESQMTKDITDRTRDLDL